jgi:hypothetical protein
MLESRMKIEGENQVHKGGEVDKEAKHAVPVGDSYLPWHQGRKPDWKQDNYAEYVAINPDADDVDKETIFSLFSSRANRIKIDMNTTHSNQRRYHDWKGYDDIEPTVVTKLFFNDIQVGNITSWPGDVLRHMLAVHRYIEQLQNHPLFGWFTPAEFEKAVGKQVDYDGYPAVIVDVASYIHVGEILIYAPTWPDDGYDRGGRLRCSLIPGEHNKINWYPDPNRERVEVPENIWS